jgi:Phosphohistidine swiveling domain
VITAGVPIGVSGTTNILKVHIVGKVLVQGVGSGTGSVTGELCVARDPAEAMEKFTEGSILVVPYTDNELLPIMKMASALIVEEPRDRVPCSDRGADPGDPRSGGRHKCNPAAQAWLGGNGGCRQGPRFLQLRENVTEEWFDLYKPDLMLKLKIIYCSFRQEYLDYICDSEYIDIKHMVWRTQKGAVN